VAEYPEDLLTRPAAAAAALVCLALLDAAHDAVPRLADPSDSEALHDFRVAVRRLRSILRSFRSELDNAVSRKLRNRLRDLTRATTAGREAEVQIESVKALVPKVTRGQRAGVPWLLARFTDQRDRAYDQIRREIEPEFQRLERRLRRALWSAARKPGDSTADVPTFGAVAAALLSEHTALLEQELATLQSADDESTAHAIRITAKRLRYLLEPLVGAEPRAGAVLARVKAIQTLLGDLHDLQVLAAHLADAVGDAAAERARRLHALSLSGARPRSPAKREPPRAATAGMLALTRLVRQAQDEIFGRFAADWQSASRAQLGREVASVAAVLVHAPTPLPHVQRQSPQPRPLRRRDRTLAAPTALDPDPDPA
jgi:CHAD domain-containing protein